MKFIYFSVLLTIIIFLIFLKLNNKKDTLTNKSQIALLDAITFSSGIALFIYVFLGKILSISYFSEVNEDFLLLGSFIASIYLMSAGGDKYYKKIKYYFNKLLREVKI